MATIHIINPSEPQREGSAIINNNGLNIQTGTYRLEPKINKPLLRVSGVMENRFNDRTYYTA